MTKKIVKGAPRSSQSRALAMRYDDSLSNQTIPFPRNGCLVGFLLPPLAVVCVGLALALFWLGSGPVTTIAAAPVPTGSISLVFRPEVQYWSGAIQVWAAAAGLDPNLVATVMQIESCGDLRARSGAGAVGLFQVMPYHFALGDDPYDPDTNAARGLAYLKHSLEAANGDVRLALAGYNGGIAVIGASESGWSAETTRYAYWGSGIYNDASNGATVSQRLQEWMAAGGASLCRQAHSQLGLSQ
ncbi:MAG: transglycosylase SLT domain-containing protein [Anaerolineales bacterium]